MMRKVAITAAVLAFVCATARADEEIVVTGHGPPKSPTILRVNPVIPRPADEVAKEGWVHVALALSATGDVTDAKVVEAYPKGWFEKAVMDVVHTWKFHPRTENGKAVADPDFDIGIAFYSDEYESGRNPNEPWERGGRVRGVTASNIGAFQRAVAFMDRNDIKAAGPLVADLAKRFNAGSMSVTDVARYFALRTRYERLDGHFDDALTYARETLLLAQFLDNGKVVFGVHLEVLASLAALQRNDELVDYYDSLLRVSKLPVPESVVAYIEGLRQTGAGKGHDYTIVDFDDTHRRRDTNTHDASGKATASQGGGADTSSMSSGASGAVGSNTGGAEETRNHLQVAVQALCLDLPGQDVGHCL